MMVVNINDYCCEFLSCVYFYWVFLNCNIVFVGEYGIGEEFFYELDIFSLGDWLKVDVI